MEVLETIFYLRGQTTIFCLRGQTTTLSSKMEPGRRGEGCTANPHLSSFSNSVPLPEFYATGLQSRGYDRAHFLFTVKYDFFFFKDCTDSVI